MSSKSWQEMIDIIATRYNQEYQGKAFSLPPEVEAMSLFPDWAAGKLQGRLASPFWELAKPQKNQHCLDLGCGISFLVYPWRDWGAFFYGQEVSSIAREILNSRAPQLNSKLFKGVYLGGAHQLPHEDPQFDLAIATGWSCYYSLDYWDSVCREVKRVLKPGGSFVFDLLNPTSDLAENWAILETYLGAEITLEPLEHWHDCLKAVGAKIVKQLPGEAFDLYQVKFS